MTSDRPLVVAAIPIAAVVVLLVNDHVLKWQLDNWWTGKLSDFAGLVFFPLLALALLEWLGTGALRRRAHVVLACAVTGLVFAAIKLVPVANLAYAELAGLVQWPGWVMLAWFDGTSLPGATPVECVRDASDLLALPAMAIPIATTRA